MGPGAHPFRVADQHERVRRQDVEQQLHLVQQQRRQRLHALDRRAVADLRQQLGQFGVLLGQAGRPAAHLGGEQQLAAGGRVDLVDDAQRALVGHRELTYLGDLVAPQLDAPRVRGRRREHVDEPTPDGELTTTLHQVDPVVARVGERAHEVVELDDRPGPQRDGLDVAQPGRLRLQHGPHGGHHDGRTAPSRRRLVRVGEPTQDGEALPHGVAARRQPLVRQRLPGRVQRDGVGAHHVRELGDQVFGFARRRGHGQDGPSGTGAGHRQRGDQHRPGGRGRGHVQRVGRAGRLDDTAQRRRRRQQSVEHSGQGWHVAGPHSGGSGRRGAVRC